MTRFGITAIRWNEDHTEVEACMVHELEPQGRGFVVQEGRPLWYTDVAALINGGDKVFVMEEDTEGQYQRGAVVEVRAGSEPYLETTPEGGLFGLPTF